MAGMAKEEEARFHILNSYYKHRAVAYVIKITTWFREAVDMIRCLEAYKTYRLRYGTRDLLGSEQLG